MYGDYPSGLIIVAVVIFVCWIITKVKDIKWPWQKF